MADKKFYSIGFNLLDNFTTKYNNLMAKVSKITDTSHDIKFEVDQSIVGKTEEIGKKVSESTNGISKSIDKVSDSNKGMQESTKKTTEATKEQTSSISQLKKGYEGFSDSLNKVKDIAVSLFAILGAGAIGGMSAVGAYKTREFKEQALNILGKANRRINTEELQSFADQAKYSGYTSGSARTSMAYTLGTRGARNTEQITKATEGIEKTFLMYDELLEKEHGITSAADLADVATRKVVGRFDRQWLDAMFGKGFSSKSQSSRIKALGKAGIDIDVQAQLDEDPFDEIQKRVKSLGDSVGKELLGVFFPFTQSFAKFLRSLDGNPIVPKIAAIGLSFSVILGIVMAIVTALPLLSKGFMSLKAGMTLISQGGGIARLGALLLNPYAILIAIGAILLIVAYKTGALSAAWEKFSKSAIGTDIISGIQGIADVIGLVVDKFGDWYEATGRSQLLTYFGYLVTLLGNAFDFMDKIYSLTKGTTGNPLLAGIVALASTPIALYAGGLKSATGIDATEILSGISDRIGSLSRWLTSNLPVGIEKIVGFLSKLFSVINWIVNPFIRIFDIIKSLFEKVTSFLEEKFGVSGKTDKLDEAMMEKDIAWAKSQRFSDNNERKYRFSDETMEAAWTEAATGKSQPHENLTDPGKYDRLVGEFKNRFKTRDVERVIPEAIPATNEESRQWEQGEWTRSGKGSMVGGRWVPSESIEGSTGLEGFAFENKGRDLTKEAATGGDIKSDGLIKLHKDETVVPADIARSSVLNSLLKNVSTAGRSGETIINVYNSPNIDLSGLKLSSDIDVDKLIKRFEDMIITGSTKAVKDALGQRRT